VSAETFSAVSAGVSHTCALTSDARAFCWGLNHLGQLGTGTLVGAVVPTPVETTLRFRSISAGVSHTCAITTDGASWCWGSNEYGELGNGGIVERGLSGTPFPDPTILGYTFQSVSAGDSFTCAVLPEERGRCWGRGLEGQLGNAQPIIMPVPLRTFDGVPVAAIATGYAHACAVGSNDQIHCWGDGRTGQIGGPTGNTSLVPRRVTIPRE
jgi:alpha-tubulin suppressor-like RCC1 family protein